MSNYTMPIKCNVNYKQGLMNAPFKNIQKPVF